MQVVICCGRAGEEGAEKGLVKILWDLKSGEVGNIYKKSYVLHLCGLFNL